MEHNTVCQDGKSIRGREDVANYADKMIVKLQNFCLAHVGISAKTVVQEVETCCCDCGSLKTKQECLVKATTNKDKQLKDECIPDNANQVGSTSLSKVLAASHNWETKLDETAELLSGEALDHDKMMLVSVEHPLPWIHKCGSLRGKRCEAITKTLVELQDSYEMDKHESLVSSLIEFYSERNDVDMQAALMIERGMAFYYANDLKKCKQLFTDVIRLGDSLKNRDLLVGKAYFLLSAVNKRKKKFNRALQCLQNAEQLFDSQEPGGDKAELYYNYGGLWLNFYSIAAQNPVQASTREAQASTREVQSKQAREKLKAKAIGYYQMAIENCSRDDRQRIQLKFQTYVHLKIAALHLNCGTTTARRTSPILEEDIKNAKKRLDFVEFQLSDGVEPSGTRVQLMINRSDLHYRQGNLWAAREVAKNALMIAQRKQINTAIAPLETRIEELENLLVCAPLSPASEMKACCMNDSGWSADGSSDDQL